MQTMDVLPDCELASGHKLARTNDHDEVLNRSYTVYVT